MSVTPLVPVLPDSAGARRSSLKNSHYDVEPLPVVELVSSIPTRDPRWAYGVKRVDCNGRVSDRAIMSLLEWRPGMRLEAVRHGGAVRLRLANAGRLRVSAAGDLWLSASVRRMLGVSRGDQVMLAADTQTGSLTVLPLRVVDDMVNAWVDQAESKVVSS
ncbi:MULTISPECIES: hypothetical protein [Nocardia]|uniref:hypothetical protein n=1 Tax=Nocardia TaxID=1817 RepID=UPI00130073BF|nr:MULTISPECIES: hypothetical protein [Nocardia]